MITKSEEGAAPQPHLELFHDGELDGVTPSAKLTWCVSRETLGMLKAKGVRNPHILLVSGLRRRDGRFVERGRRLIPLDAYAAYPEFTAPGEFRVFPFLVWDEDGDEPSVYLKRGHRGGYATDVINDDGSPVETDDKIPGAYIEVSVPEDFFGKPHGEKLTTWVNLWHSTEPRDQCSFRRRFIGAFTYQPIVIGLWLIATTIFRFLAATFLTIFMGNRGVNWKAIVQPWNEDADAVWEDVSNFFFDSVFWSKSRVGRKSAEWEPQNVLLVPFTPILGIGAFFASMIYTSNLLVNIAFGLGFAFVPMVLLAGALALVAGLAVAIPALGVWLKKGSNKPRKPVTDKDFIKLEPVICPGTGVKPLRSARPRRVRLVFADFKAKVCKPYITQGDRS